MGYYRKIDSIVSDTGDPFPEVKDVYHQLILHSLAQNDKKRQIEYMGKLITYDSLYAAKQEKVLNETMASYDIPYFKHQKKKAEAQLENKQRMITTIALLAALAILSGVYFYVRSIRMRRKLELLL